jgi:hypothetical protein
MARTQFNSGEQTASNTIVRSDVNTSTAGSAIITKLILADSNTSSLTYTGADSGTGDVTLTVLGFYDMHFVIQGIMANAEVFTTQITRPMTWPASLTGSYASAKTAATASTVFTLKRNGTSIGTITFAASGTTGTFSFASSVTWAAGDLFEMDGPATADTTLANINIDLAGNM